MPKIGLRLSLGSGCLTDTMNGDGRGLPPTSEALNATGMSWTGLYDAVPVQHGEMMSSAGPSTSNISNSLPALPRPKKRQSTVSRGSSDDEGDDDRKRPKAALSCSECSQSLAVSMPTCTLTNASRGRTT